MPVLHGPECCLRGRLAHKRGPVWRAESWPRSFWRAESWLKSFWRAESWPRSFWRAESWPRSFWRAEVVAPYGVAAVNDTHTVLGWQSLPCLSQWQPGGRWKASLTLARAARPEGKGVIRKRGKTAGVPLLVRSVAAQATISARDARAYTAHRVVAQVILARRGRRALRSRSSERYAHRFGVAANPLPVAMANGRQPKGVTYSCARSAP